MPAHANSPHQLEHYLGVAHEVVAEARELFLAHLGAAPALYKGKGDFATEADLAIEELLRRRLEAATGIPVFGEEQGGKLNNEACWVVDPIDGTSNYSSGNPNCAILVSLLLAGEPVVAVTDIPLLHTQLSCRAGGPVLLNHDPLPQVDHTTAVAWQVGVGSVGSDDRQAFPAHVRLQLVGALADAELRPRISGSVGVDLAFVAQGVYQAAVSFSPYIWDNAAGVCLARSAGASVSAPDGSSWTTDSVGVVIGTPSAHEMMLSSMKAVRATPTPDPNTP
ncbi:inositol monophosphatase family protein [Corynebacterium sp. p3-SID1056]|uniref:inositol monophosphatase family protein n=1 Tax=Corynebacterium sp. p3-SID1056 TaxID=2916092 RepID=UPI0021A79322|nr:inositol monophosphatase family protein [Corynebacterium sp. p3-SID1056]MCT2337884.1 inositol monophosphatase family protein [Corynebacterium sp. p3-SID1056]